MTIVVIIVVIVVDIFLCRGIMKQLLIKYMKKKKLKDSEE